ncbi:coenzyme F430 synthase [Methanothermococcus okinawensis]|uniref:Mur ligase middle domain protein n=1 Tax=Methanothermococcus okinawensis (strain DSM 14208 / JCM 11175 / IH1) TaxID=647113 RepID=F8AM85_METOI|nr:coenzyme F430 synthase [Methanothermococcus okinawensis]AEH06773.1 Mur ligase middle domain protein [Methanothermococcus okinawensis IH1]
MLIIDVNHGALDIAKEYINLGYNVSVWDIYGKLEKDKDILKNLNYSMEHINLISSKEKPDFEKYDNIIAPIHCPIDCNFISFHDAISELLYKKYGNIHKKFIEITGVKGKTTTTELLYYILKDEYNIFLNNSNSGSITPVSVLNHINRLNEENKLDLYNLFIFEVSLGITSCKYGALTNVVENYPIGKGRRNALNAKLYTLKNADRIYINKNILDNYGYDNNNLDLVNNNIKYKYIDNKYVDNKNNDNLKKLTAISPEDAEIISKYPLKYKYNNKIIEFSKYIFGAHYIEDSLFALNICKNFVNCEYIIDKIKTFEIKNRMNIKEINNRYMIENINPGLNVKSIDYAIKDFSEIFDGIVIIGGDFGCTCEELNVRRLSNIINKYKNKSNIKFILTGALGKKLKKYVNYPYVENYNFKSTELDKNILIIYRKAIN